VNELNVNEEQQKTIAQYQGYRIVILGELDPSWSEWLGGLEVAANHDQDGKSVTSLSGEIPDQASLRGVLNKIWDLHLTLLSVTQIHASSIENHKEVNYE
jgi:hypothetical protein